MGTMKGNNLTKVKKQNESLIKEVLYKYAPISRSEIAEMLALTPPTITTNIASMVERGLVYECSDAEEDGHGLGRRPVKINFVEDACYFIGVELNPYQAAVCIVNLRGTVKGSLRLPWNEYGFLDSRMSNLDSNDYGKTLDMLAQRIQDLIETSHTEKKRILGVGFGIPGFVERKTGILRKSTLHTWNDKDIARDLSRLLDIPVMLENNARARAIGQEMFSRDVRPETFAYYLISYGIACPLYFKNSVLDGEQEGSGEAGHMVAVLNGPKCETCGNYGCLEEVASERAIVKMVRQAIADGHQSMLTENCPNIEEIGMKEILLAQECGDNLADEVIHQAIMHLGAVLGNIINLINPPLVFVDGYIMRLKRNRRQLLEETRSHIFGLYDEEVEIEFVDFDQFTGAKGAAAMAIKKYFIKA